MFNINNKVYDLRRVSANGLNAGSTLFGAETKDNYVVDVNEADAKADLLDATTDKLDWYTVEEIKRGKADKWEGSDKVGNYHIWRYAMENTIHKGARLVML